MATIILDSASKLEVTRRSLADVLAEVGLLREALGQDLSDSERPSKLEEARHALSRLDATLAEMQEVLASQ